MKIKKTIVITLFGVFVLFTIYKVVLIYVLNVTSLKSSYIYHSKSVEISKKKGLYVDSYILSKTLSNAMSRDYLVPTELFIEKEKVIYPQYYFYWGKSEIGDRYSMNGNPFLKLSEVGNYDIYCPSSTLPTEKENIDKYRESINFFFKTQLPEIVFIIVNCENRNKADTLVYRKLQ
jgi:hypothetical protein